MWRRVVTQTCTGYSGFVLYNLKFMTNEIVVMRKKRGFRDYTEIDLRTSAARSFS